MPAGGPDVAVIDYGVGNVGSVLNMLHRVGCKAAIVSKPDDLAAAQRLILPGVGSFDFGMEQLRARGLVEVLHECALERRVPFLGICLGSQLMARSSEEGNAEGLAWFDATVVKFRQSSETARLRLPHMGWNEVRIQPGARLFQGPDVGAKPRFYFVHSYHLSCSSEADVAAYAQYGYEFAAAIQKGNLYGVQFHPEKSHRFGLRLLAAFAAIDAPA